MPQLDIFAYLSHVTFIVLFYYFFLWILIRNILPKLLLSIVIKRKFNIHLHLKKLLKDNIKKNKNKNKFLNTKSLSKFKVIVKKHDYLQ